ncbi:hypothetical protein HJC23_012994 [Cyclotella cryptica]|uniref:FAM192A/Fyv6 N-terminal domain-containing protein n=1 Tax=Cyclotella cryptica TaxID=29204 RepID=A0ABD3QFT7_9STRA|eukprot:CCRYP_005590-RA/>CCRYP_005590-RA protein AED:0.20 eAED:0.20 QI:0/-1/0/1/-1/1/1/0/239
MSLSFVKSAVLSSSDGISHNEEKSIVNPETTSLRSRSITHKPLFEQLRANKDAEQEAHDEFQRSLRGTRLLDDEDCAHLDAVERVKEEREREVKSGIEREVALFRARREDRGLVQSCVGVEEDETVSRDPSTETAPLMNEAKKGIIPKFIVKKKKRRKGSESINEDEKPSKIVRPSDKNENAGQGLHNKYSNTILITNSSPGHPSKENATSSETGDDSKLGAVSGLLGLGCYGSDSDDD